MAKRRDSEVINGKVYEYNQCDHKGPHTVDCVTSDMWDALEAGLYDKQTVSA